MIISLFDFIVPESEVELNWVRSGGGVGDSLVGCLYGEYADFDGLLLGEGVVDFGGELLYYCFVHLCRLFCWSHSMSLSICSSVRSSRLIVLRLICNVSLSLNSCKSLLSQFFV